jgi:glycerol-3-phosphate dehydrogenase
MSEEFEVRGVHEDALDHAAESGDSDRFAGRIAVMTAILSTAGAVFGYQGGATQNEELLLKNEAAIHKTEAANQWAYYQAKSQKQAIAELSAQLPGVDHDAAKREAQRYASEKEQIRQTAEAQEHAASEADKASELAVHHHHRWAQAVVAIQVSIALAAITLLSRRRWLQVFSYGVGGVGGVLAVMALLHL